MEITKLSLKKTFAETDLPLITPNPIPSQSKNEKDPNVISILGTNVVLKIKKAVIHGALLSYYLLFNGHSGEASHIVVNDCHYGKPRMLFRNATRPENVTFCYETFGGLICSSVVFSNEKLGEVNFEKKIIR